MFGVRRVLPDSPIDVAPEDNPTSEPEPDIVFLKGNLSHFKKENPKPHNLALVVEVADTTLHFALTTKALLYAGRASPTIGYWTLRTAG